MPLDILNRFSSNLKNTLVRAINLSIKLKHPRVMPLHLLASLSEQNGSIASEIITKHNLKKNNLHNLLHRMKWPADDALHSLPQLSSETVRVLEHAAVIAFEHEHKHIGTEHLLLSLVELPDKQLIDVFKRSAINSEDIRSQTVNVLRSTTQFPDLTGVFKETDSKDSDVAEPSLDTTQLDTPAPDQPTSATPALDFFCTDLTTVDIQKNIDPVIGRSEEIDRLIHILSRRNKNNPVLLGEPGVGKTAIVEGLAKRIIEGDIPNSLRNKRIYKLDLGLVVAGTMYRGEFEARFKQITEELKDNKNIVLFIDEIHTLIGAGGTGGNAMDAANILKPGLARGDIRCIGATTLGEYQKHIESDPALERRLQSILVEEPSIEEAISVLHGVKSNYEDFHRVYISDEAIEAAVKFSTRYIQDKFLPDKAIDLIDEAAARHKIEKPTNPLEQKLSDLEARLKVVQSQKLLLVRDEKFEDAISLKKKERHIKKAIEEVTDQLKNSGEKISGTIYREDIARVISRVKNIPLENLIASEKSNVLNLKEHLDTFVIGQPEATTAVSEFIKRAQAGLDAPNRPIGSFMFLGPSGVGKTELAKTLAREVFGSEDNMIRLDMSEFSEGFTVSKLIGAPAGYVGYKEGGKLTDQIKHKPYSLVLFDEIEKAHPDVFNLLLQILEDGHVTDSTGKKIDFKNTIVIMTSNIGLEQFQSKVGVGFSDADTMQPREYEHIKEEIMKELGMFFRPELLNRIDKTVVFQPLSSESLLEIVDLQLYDLIKRASERSIKLKATKSLKKHIASQAYSPDQGARAMRKTIQELVENPLADKMLNDDIIGGDSISIGFQHNAVTFTHRNKRKKVSKKK